MIKAVTFDTDGMLVITEMFSVQYQKEYGVPKDELLPFFQNEFKDCLVGKADLKKRVSPYLNNWKWEKSVDEFLNYWFNAENHVDKRVVEIIYKLRKSGIKCYLATNQEKYRTNFLRNEMGFNKIFDKVFSSAEVGYKKPEAEFFDIVCRKIGLAKGEIQFWDDTDKNVEGAKEYGLDARKYDIFEDFKIASIELIK